jgi:hypothetical protein
MNSIVATILLGGTVRPTSFSTAIQRSFLDLPFDRKRTLLHIWCRQLDELSDQYPGVSRVLRILTDQSAASVIASNVGGGVSVHVERDPSAWRGTGGVLRDIAIAYEPDSYILVANAAQVLLAPLRQFLAPLLSLNADVAMIGYSDGTPVTFMLVRCGCLRLLAEVGYLDMKEQALPIIAKDHKVKVASFDVAMSHGIRTADTYIAALRSLSGRTDDSPFAETWQSSFDIVEEPSNVDTSARLHDSVVLRGATVGRGAILVRSVVCPGAVVPPNAVYVGKLVSMAGEESTSEDSQ